MFQPTDNKLAMKLFGSKKALIQERVRQKAAGHWIIHPCSSFRYICIYDCQFWLLKHCWKCPYINMVKNNFLIGLTHKVRNKFTIGCTELTICKYMGWPRPSDHGMRLGIWGYGVQTPARPSNFWHRVAQRGSWIQILVSICNPWPRVVTNLFTIFIKT